jgi:hypothetical protein
MFEYLTWVSQVAGGYPWVVTLYISPTHRTGKVVGHTDRMQMELLFVAAGATGCLQPLDRSTFGELKSRVRAQFQRLFAETGVRGVDFRESLEVLADCWNRITPENVRKTWRGIE